MKRVRVGSDNNKHGTVDEEMTVEMVQGALALEELLFDTLRVFVMYSIYREQRGAEYMPAIPHAE
jgi:hypothetical protein